MKPLARFTSIFKKFSTIDILFIAIGTLLLAGIYFVFKREVVYITARFKVTDENVFYALNSPRDEYALSFVIGDTERNELGKIVSEIVGIESYKKSPDRMVVYLDIRLQATYNPRKNVYTVRGKNIVFGELFTLNFSKVKIKALVVDFPGFSGYKNMKSGTTTVRAQLRYDSRQFSDVYGVPSYLAYAIRPGDTVKDSQKNILAKILDVQVVPAKRTVISSTGNSFQTNDSELKDVYYTIELATKIVGDKIYMFDYDPVEIGGGIALTTKTVTVWPTIIEIQQ